LQIATANSGSNNMTIRITSNRNSTENIQIEFINPPDGAPKNISFKKIGVGGTSEHRISATGISGAILKGVLRFSDKLENRYERSIEIYKGNTDLGDPILLRDEL